MTVNGWMIELMVLGLIYNQEVLNILVNGSTINSTIKVKKSGQTVLNLKVITSMAKKKDMENSSGLTTQVLVEILSKM